MWYALIVGLLSLAGAAVPLVHRPGHAQLQIYLSLAAGALLGAAMFHLLPESSELVHGGFGLPAVAGVALVFFLQRYVAPHSHEVASLQPHGAAGAGSHACDADDHHHGAGSDDNQHGHRHHHDPGHADHVPTCHAGVSEAQEKLRTAGPVLTGAVAIVALSVHSFFDGVAIGAAGGAADGSSGALPLAVFLSVMIHKPMDGVSVSVLLLDAGVGRGKLWAVQIAYAALVPIGAAAFVVTQGAITDAPLFIGYTLAFSAGTFLAIALTDLLPELHFHTHDRNKLSAALLAGLAVMWLTSFIGHGDGHADDDHVGAAASREQVISTGETT